MVLDFLAEELPAIIKNGEAWFQSCTLIPILLQQLRGVDNQELGMVRSSIQDFEAATKIYLECDPLGPHTSKHSSEIPSTCGPSNRVSPSLKWWEWRRIMGWCSCRLQMQGLVDSSSGSFNPCGVAIFKHNQIVSEHSIQTGWRGWRNYILWTTPLMMVKDYIKSPQECQTSLSSFASFSASWRHKSSCTNRESLAST